LSAGVQHEYEIRPAPDFTWIIWD